MADSCLALLGKRPADTSTGISRANFAEVDPGQTRVSTLRWKTSEEIEDATVAQGVEPDTEGGGYILPRGT